MRYLSILRHGKAEANSPDGGDHNRPLAAKGRHRTAMLGRDLAASGLVPDQILCSDATRTAETARYLLAGAGIPRRVLLLPELYEADCDELFELVQECGDPAAAHLMVIGHNPTVQMAAEWLGAAAATVGPVFEKFSPGTNALFSVDRTNWHGLDPRNMTLERTFLPSSYA